MEEKEILVSLKKRYKRYRSLMREYPNDIFILGAALGVQSCIISIEKSTRKKNTEALQ